MSPVLKPLSPHKVHHQMHFVMSSHAFRHVLMTFCHEWTVHVEHCDCCCHIIRLRLVDSDSADIGVGNISFKTSVKYLLNLTRLIAGSNQQRLSRLFSWIKKPCVHPTVPFWKNFRKACPRFDNIPSDYCNSVLAGLPAEQTGRLQRVQNCAARFVLKKRKRDHITSLLTELHWLPVNSRCEYKTATFACRHFDSTLPSYLSASLCTHQASRTLRSPSEKLLKIEIFWWASLRLSGIGCLPVCQISPLFLGSKPSSNNRLCVCERVHVCIEVWFCKINCTT